ncbi:MAG: CopG family transcriptional regulator [Anaerolineales bacterium]|nr:CopG family transcriptional regulator [Anaerolineales bacterium]
MKLPSRLAEQVNLHVEEGWFSDLNSLVVEAVRRYLETHNREFAERFILEDVEWGLKGDERLSN